MLTRGKVGGREINWEFGIRWIYLKSQILNNTLYLKNKENVRETVKNKENVKELVAVCFNLYINVRRYYIKFNTKIFFNHIFL